MKTYTSMGLHPRTLPATTTNEMPRYVSHIGLGHCFWLQWGRSTRTSPSQARAAGDPWVDGRFGGGPLSTISLTDDVITTWRYRWGAELSDNVLWCILLYFCWTHTLTQWWQQTTMESDGLTIRSLAHGHFNIWTGGTAIGGRPGLPTEQSRPTVRHIAQLWVLNCTLLII